jgi:uncharacterized membrane protein YkvA (DUF1232 family)
MAPFSSWLRKPLLLRALVSRLRLAARLLRDPRVPARAKAFLLAPALYVVFPIDVLPDVIPIVGQLDDLAAVLACVELFVGLCPREVVDFHKGALDRRQPFAPAAAAAPASGDVIDAEWRAE